MTKPLPPELIPYFQQAQTLHRMGELSQAERLYGQILQLSPAQPEVWHQMCVIAAQVRRFEIALKHITKALELAPSDPRYLLALGNVRLELGDPAAAADAFRKALRREGDNAQLLYQLANALMAQDQWMEAAKLLRRAAFRAPGNWDVQTNLGLVSLRLGASDDALKAFQRALAIAPDNPKSHFNLGNAYKSLARLDEAEAAWRSGLRGTPDDLMLINVLLPSLEKRNAHGEISDLLLPRLELIGGEPDLMLRLGNALVHERRGIAAIEAAQMAMRAWPGNADFIELHALALQTALRWPEALAEIRRAVELAPADHQIRLNLANIALDCHEAGLAEASFSHVAAHGSETQRAEALFARGLLRLSQGQYERGLPDYENRFAATGDTPPVAAPQWQGDALNGRKLLVWAEQGLGDTIHFARYLSRLPEGEIDFLAPAALGRILAPLCNRVHLIHDAGGLPPSDCQVALMSLPLRLGDPIPPAPYLAADPAAWRGRLDAMPEGLKVGLCWAGNTEFSRDDLRSVPALALAPLGTVPDCRFVSLQLGRAAPEFVADWTGELADFTDTAALIAGLDLVIAVDTAVAHLAGALGKPVWLLNRYNSCWRWGWQGETSAWYPSMRIFRQSRPGDWTDVIAAAARALSR